MAKIVDGQKYDDGDVAWDLGSFECIDEEGDRRHYSGLSADIGKLPKYDSLATGSTAQCLDNGDFYIYHASTKTWYRQ